MHWLVIAMISYLNLKRRNFPMPNATACRDELFCAAPAEPLLVKARRQSSKILAMAKLWRQCYQPLTNSNVCRNFVSKVVF